MRIVAKNSIVDSVKLLNLALDSAIFIKFVLDSAFFTRIAESSLNLYPLLCKFYEFWQVCADCDFAKCVMDFISIF